MGNLGLYSITFVNELEQDREALLWYKEFREEAERKQFRHFLEIFDPNVDSGIPPEKLGEFINDNILRTLAGVPDAGRPVFLKIVYHGPKAMEELAQYDPNLVVGILGIVHARDVVHEVHGRRRRARGSRPCGLRDARLRPGRR